MAGRRGVLDKKYVFEYDIGQWTFGTVSVLKDREKGTLKLCRTVPKVSLRAPGNVLVKFKQLEDLQHPHICGITDALEDPLHYFIISDFCAGGDVADWVERLGDGNWLQENTCAAYIRQVLLALAHSHAARVYHRDLRPSNLLLTSKLPDASIKVSDFGLASILDPRSSAVRENPNSFTAPEVCTGPESACNGGAPDMWSIGAIAHALLVGQPPSESSGSGIVARMRSNRALNEFWSERSDISRDFVERLLRPAADRPTPAKALQHPWLKGVVPISSVSWQADTEVAREIRYKTLCYMLAVLLIPVLVPHRDFEQLRIAFVESDADGDGFVSRHVVQKLLYNRCAFSEAVSAAMTIADVAKTDVLDLCAAACADLIAREFFASGPTTQPLAGSFKATDLAQRMMKQLFESFGDRRQSASTVTVTAMRSRLRTATARDVELNAGVRYDDIISCLPEDRPIDGKELASQIHMHSGLGTPLGCGDMSPVEHEGSWASTFGLDVFSMFQGCGVGSMNRGDSPHSVRIF